MEKSSVSNYPAPRKEGNVSDTRPPRYLRVAEAAQYCCLSKSTFDKLRLTNDGAVFIRVGGRVLYSTDDLDAWLARHRVRSTSAPGPASGKPGLEPG